MPGVLEVAQVQASRSRIDPATRDVAPPAWRRHLCLLLDGFRAERAHHVTEALAQVPHRLLALGVGSDEDQLLDGFRITDAVGAPHRGNRHAGVLGRVITSQDLPWSATGRSHRRVG
ncbi:hypothetical protein AB0D27_26475 [Streptomyces sp. NPDC048415]|uniref:hypothetical protein n=1 Tax=Streptomyces sp. NPDC048415 TaxID=3154822 RepID=UPI00343C02A5